MFLKKINTFILILIMSFITKKNSSEEVLFDNFSKKTEKKWEFISDQVMGGVSYGKHDFLSDSRKNYIRMTGFVSLDNNGGFIQVRRKLSKGEQKIIKGIKLELRGNNQGYYVHIRTKYTFLPWQYYQGKLATTEEWKEIKLRLEYFKRSGRLLPKKINPKHVTSIALVAFGIEQDVRLDVSKITFY